jgi:hypothetical protein
MTPSADTIKRRTFRWPKEARELVRSNLQARGSEARDLITKLKDVSGNPRDACIRFARQLGLRGKRSYYKWPQQEQQRLLRLIELYPVRETARRMRRSEFAVYAMLRRMGTSATVGKDGFTLYSLAALLHIRPDEVRTWINRGWLAAHTEGTERLPRIVIGGDDFSTFCKRYGKLVVGNRLHLDRLEFVRSFVFAPSHAELLPVRAAKKERAAYDEQINNGLRNEDDLDQNELQDEQGAVLGLTA